MSVVVPIRSQNVGRQEGGTSQAGWRAQALHLNTGVPGA